MGKPKQQAADWRAIAKELHQRDSGEVLPEGDGWFTARQHCESLRHANPTNSKQKLDAYVRTGIAESFQGRRRADHGKVIPTTFYRWLPGATP